MIAAIIFVGYLFSNKPRDLSVQRSVRIGFIAPLTGPFAEWGQTIQEGLKLALEDVKHDFQVDYQDSACEPKLTVNIAKKFFEMDNIKLVLGPGCVTGLRAIAPMAQEKNALLFSTGLLDDIVFIDHKNVINLASQISTEALYMAKYLSEQGIGKVAVVHGTNYFGEEYGRRLPAFLKNFGIEVVSVHPSDLNLRDFKSVIVKIFKEDPDAIFIHQGEAPTGIFVRQLRDLGKTTPIYSYYASEAESVLEAGDDALNGMHYTYPVSSAEESQEKMDFEKRYTEKFGANKTPSATSFFVYDGMMIMDKAMDSCRSDDTVCIGSFFRNLGNYSGISGEMKFEKDGSITRPFGMKMVENGRFVWVTKEIKI